MDAGILTKADQQTSERFVSLIATMQHILRERGLVNERNQGVLVSCVERKEEADVDPLGEILGASQAEGGGNGLPIHGIKE